VQQPIGVKTIDWCVTNRLARKVAPRVRVCVKTVTSGRWLTT
jgi:hypothetical protein